MKVNKAAKSRHVRLLPVAVAAQMLLFAAQPVAAEDMLRAPIDVNGDLGYTFRSLSSDVAGDSYSNQLRGGVNASTWLWQPWLATVDLGIRGTFDDSKTEHVGVTTSHTAQILTGDLNLGILPQSRTPLSISFRASDSRVDTLTGDNPLTGLGGREYSTQRLSVKQRYFTESGHRLMAYFDQNHWDSNGDTYDDWLLGADMSVRLPKQTLTAKASYQNSDYSVLDQNTKTRVLNVDHFYYPGRALRIDSMASLYNYDRTSKQPLNSTNNADSTTDLTQLSSFVFYRPEDTPLSVSGGVRLYDLNGDTAGNSVGVQNVSATAGMFYQWTKNLRFDANADMSTNDNDDTRVTTSRERMGALYQSDIHDIFGGMTWQWYSSLSGQLRDADGDRSGTVEVRLGHDTQKLWVLSKSETWRFSFSQSGSQNRVRDDGTDTDTTQLNHSTSLSWDIHGQTGMTVLQVTLADSRQSGDVSNNQQFFNFQILRNQNIDRVSELNGNLTLQKIRRDFYGAGNNDTVTTATGQINYNHSRIMGVPHLRFTSDLRVSKAVSDEWVNRGEWENRLDYVIGLLDTRLSWRKTVLDSDNYDLVYIQVSRRF
jgi:hypothetical protein